MPNVDLRDQFKASGSGTPSIPGLPLHWQEGAVNDVYTPFPVFVRANVAGNYSFVPGSGAAAVTMTLAAGETIGMVKQVTSAAGAFHIGI